MPLAWGQAEFTLPGAWKPLQRRRKCRRQSTPRPCGRGGIRACTGPKGLKAYAALLWRLSNSPITRLGSLALADIKSQSNGCAAGCGLVALIGFAVVLVSSLISGPAPPTPDDQMASFVCGDFIKKRLRDPSSADFVTDPLKDHAQLQHDGSYLTFLTVRANNGFGGKSVSTFSCTVAKDKDGNWSLQNLDDLGVQL